MTILFTIGWQSIALPCFHIRTSAALRLFAAPRSFSQLITSFFGSWCQGILHVLFFAWPFSLALFNNDLSFSLAILNYVSKLFRFCCFSVTLLHILYARVLSEKTWFFLTLLFIQFSNIFVTLSHRTHQMCSGGGKEIRTPDPLLARQVLSQLSYTPIFKFSEINRFWWAEVDSNHRPHAYQACALTCWAISPHPLIILSTILWWLKSRQ